MKDDRKSVALRLNEQQNEAVERWMSESLCSRQVSIVGLLVQGAKSMGVWNCGPLARGTHFVRTTTNNLTNTGSESSTGGTGSTGGMEGSGTGGTGSADGTSGISDNGGTGGIGINEGTCSTSVASATSEENIKSEITTSFSEFWYSISSRLRRGLQEEAKRKWHCKRVQVALRKCGLSPADVAARYVKYANANRDGYSTRYVKHVSSWLDSFGFLDDLPSPDEAGRLYVDNDMSENPSERTER